MTHCSYLGPHCSLKMSRVCQASDVAGDVRQVVTELMAAAIAFMRYRIRKSRRMEREVTEWNNLVVAVVID